MKITKISLSICCILSICAAHSGFKFLTSHSRANCINNESITWWFEHSMTLRTRSTHYYNNKFKHTIDTGWQNTSRSAAVHWGEGHGTGWYVHGEHWVFTDRPTHWATTDATDCNIYDGWWDK